MKRLLFLVPLTSAVVACGDDRGGRQITVNPTVTPVVSPSVTRPDQTPSPSAKPQLVAYDVPPGSRPHDVAPAADGGVWYTAQAAGALGYLDPATGEVRQIPLGEGSAPHGVILGPDGAPWITTAASTPSSALTPRPTVSTSIHCPPGGQPRTSTRRCSTATECSGSRGQAGIVGRFNPEAGTMEVFDAPRGRGPYGITATPDGHVYYASLAGSYVGLIEPATAEITVLDPPTSGQGARRVWSDSADRIWVSEWDAGQVGIYDPASGTWREWRLPSAAPQAYAVYVDESDVVWLTDFGANAIVRFNPETERFEAFPLPDSPGEVRQLHGRPGEVWGPSPPRTASSSSATEPFRLVISCVRILNYSRIRLPMSGQTTD